MKFKSFFQRLLIAFAIASLMLMPTMQVSANDGGIPSNYQEKNAIASVGTSVAQITLLAPFQVGATETIKQGYIDSASFIIKPGLLGVVDSYKDRPGWQYRSPI